MDDQTEQDALEVSLELLRLYSPHKPPKFAGRPARALVQPERRIREALAEAQFVLDLTSKAALERRSKFLRSSTNRQRTLNILHFVSGSGFVSLIALDNPEFVKWLGAIISLAAGIIALILPKDLGTLEKGLSQDIDALASLAGEVASIQTELLLESDLSNKELLARATQALRACMQLSKKYELDQLAALNNYNLHETVEQIQPAPAAI